MKKVKVITEHQQPEFVVENRKYIKRLQRQLSKSEYWSLLWPSCDFRPKIVGISLVKNEDVNFFYGIKNVIHLCDRIYILDNHSKDNTYNIARQLQKRYPSKIRLSKIDDPLTSGVVLEKYINTNTWILRLDGDEIIDPYGFERVRQKIINDEWKNYHRINAAYLHCTLIDYRRKIAQGYLDHVGHATLYNFNSILSWEQNERLHGKNLVLKEGYDGESADLRLKDEDKNILRWEYSYFRAIHACFTKRSKLESPSANPRVVPWVDKLYEVVITDGKIEKIQYKSCAKDRYRTGQVYERGIKNFIEQ